MDIPETYIKMFEKAEEIQALCKRELGDIFCDPEHQIVKELDELAILGNFITIDEHIFENTVTSGGYDYDFYVIDWGKLIWLPHQDQLQEMIKDLYFDPTPRKLIKVFWDWIAHSAPLSDWSMDQLWLAFVMKQKHNKVWNGEDWIKQREEAKSYF